MTRYVFDVTALRQYMARQSQLSGIQRVSVMTIDRARKKIGADHIWFGYHERLTNSYKVCPCPTDSAYDLTNYATLCELFHITPTRPDLPGMERYPERSVKRRFHMWQRDLRVVIGDRNFFHRRGLSLDEWKAKRAQAFSPGTIPQSHESLKNISRPGDRLVLLDNAWHPKGLEPWLKHARTKLGLDVCILLHDLIPLVTPQYTEGDICVRFHDWLMRSMEYVTCYLANSENTGRDLRAFLNAQSAAQPVKVVPLAQDQLSPAKHSIQHGRSQDTKQNAYPAFTQGARMPDQIRALTKTSYVLVVGTMEVRKNLWQLATVWDRLRQQSGRDLPKLVFAGQRGWLNDDFDALMRATGQLGGWAEIVEGPSDDVLSYLYRNCLFTVTASFYEGWGLPIGESLGYGKTAVVSNTSSMPEVGGDMVEYCDPHSLDSIETACLRLIDEPAHRVMLEDRIAKASLRSWDMVAQDVLEAVRSF